MQRLHLVGFTTEHDGLVFSARKGSKAGGYIIPLDKELLSTIAEAERLRNGDKGEGENAAPRARPASRLTPREIQAHLRAGRSIPEVAAEAGVDADWVERFAVPVVAEQAQMVERARAMTYSKARLGQSTQPLGTSVRWNLADKGVAIGEEEFEQGWSAFQLQDEVWMIRFRYTSRARLQVAEWELDLDTNQLVSRNRLASELGYVEKGRRPPALPVPTPRVAAAPPVRIVEEVVEEPEPEEQSEPAPPARPARRRSAARRTRQTAPRKKSTARKAPAKKSTTKRATTKKTTTKKARAKKASPKRTTPKRTTPKRATRKKAARKTAKATRRRPPARPEPVRSAPRPAPTRTATRKRRTPPAPRPAAANQQPEPIEKVETRPAPRLAATKAHAERPGPLTTSQAAPERARRPARARPPVRDVEGDIDDFDELDVPPARPPRADQPDRPRIAASSAKEAASKHSGHAATRKAQPAPARRPRPVAARTARKARKTSSSNKGAGTADKAANPALSGPLARSLLARRLAARKSTPGSDGGKSQRPLRVK